MTFQASKSLCAPGLVTKLKRLGRPVPKSLLEASRAYHRESKSRCRRSKHLESLRFSRTYHVCMGVAYETEPLE